MSLVERVSYYRQTCDKNRAGLFPSGKSVANFAEQYMAAFRLGVRIRGISVYAVPVTFHDERRRLSSPHMDPQVLGLVAEHQSNFRPRREDLVAMLGSCAYHDAILFRDAFVLAAMDMASHAALLLEDEEDHGLGDTRGIFLQFVIASWFIKRAEASEIVSKRFMRQAIHRLAAMAVHEILSKNNRALHYEALPLEEIQVSARSHYLINLIGSLEKFMVRLPCGRADDLDIYGIEELAERYIECADLLLYERSTRAEQDPLPDGHPQRMVRANFA